MSLIVIAVCIGLFFAAWFVRRSNRNNSETEPPRIFGEKTISASEFLSTSPLPFREEVTKEQPDASAISEPPTARAAVGEPLLQDPNEGWAIPKEGTVMVAVQSATTTPSQSLSLPPISHDAAPEPRTEIPSGELEPFRPATSDASVPEVESPISPPVPPEPSGKEGAGMANAKEEDFAKDSAPVATIDEVVHPPGTLNDRAEIEVQSQPESPTPSTIVDREKEPGAQTSQQQMSKARIAPRPPTYRPTAPSATIAPSRKRPSVRTPPTQAQNADLRLRVQIVFGRGGTVRNLTLVPDRRDGMPSEIEVVGTQGKLHLAVLREDCYEPITLPDAGNALLQGVEWLTHDDGRRWRWVLGRRELYVLAPGDEFGLHGFVSTARLWMNARHVVLAAKALREAVLSALAAAGCAGPEVSDDTCSGVPSGWLLFRDVMPTRFVPMSDERDILNSLCPAHEIEPHFVGGIRLERNTWLVGYPPRIRFTGEMANSFQVKIDGQAAQLTSDGAFEARGWDSEGEHRLWFGDRAETYSLRTIDETWQQWRAHDFGTGAAICGASTCTLDTIQRRQVRVYVGNPLLIGARPGEISFCNPRSDVRCDTFLAQVPFVPVWALPMDAAHADKQSARILLIHPIEPQTDIHVPRGSPATARNLVAWVAAIRGAGCKGLRLTQEDEHTKVLWRQYRIFAKQLSKRMR